MRNYDPEHYLGHLRARKGQKTAAGKPEVLHIQDPRVWERIVKEPGVIRCDNEGTAKEDGNFFRLV
jgi:hypothetical protein